MQAPTSNAISQTKHGQFNAVDYRAKDRNEQWNKTIYAPEDGKITAYGPSGDCGNRLELTAGANRHGFCHLERPLVNVGATVKKGQPIGIMGYTGKTIPVGVNGSHLHWVIHRNGAYVYPITLVNEPFTIYTPPTNQGGSEVFQNDEEVKQAYVFLRGNEGTPEERRYWIGKSKQSFFVVGLPEANGYRAQLAEVRAALANEQAKPPKEVVKIVEKIIEKPVEVIKIQEIIKEVPAEVNERAVVEGFFKRIWNSLFKK